MSSIDTEFFGGQAVKWVSGTTYPIDFIVRSTISPHNYVKITSSVGGTTDPSGDETNWRRLGAGAIKSIAGYSFSISSGNTSTTVTISAVNTSKAVILNNGSSTSLVYDSSANVGAFPQITTSTTVTVSRVNTGSTAQGYFTVVEYW